MSTKHLPYRPLQAQLQEIRLLTILPGDSGDPIRCSINHASLNAAPIYNALSYVWGDSGQQGNVLLLEETEVPITANLSGALKQLRPPLGNESLCIWIDALCINQQDVAERSQQVSMMRDIYASAEKVIVWLGEASEGSDEAFDALPTITSKDNLKDEQLRVMRQCSSFFFTLADRRPWFTRTWILQELAMAKKDPLVVCGGKSAPWSMLMDAWGAIATGFFVETGLANSPPGEDENRSVSSTTDNQRSSGSSAFTRPKLKIDVLDDLRKAMREHGGMSLRQLLMISRTSSSTDPRDRIYGLLGLLGLEGTGTSSGKSIEIDYNKSISAVYADAIAHIFSRGEGPFFLSGIFLPGISEPTTTFPESSASAAPKLPSWVPDFSRQTAAQASQPSGIIFHPPANLGGASGAGADSHNGKVLEDNITLRVEGLIVDRIAEVAPFGSSLQDCVGILPDFEAMTGKATSIPCTLDSSTIASFVEQWKTSEPLWRILISNKQWKSGYEQAPTAYEHEYQGLLHQHSSGLTENNITDTERSEYELCLKSSVGKKALFTSESGFVGTCIPDAKVGDTVVVIFGSPVPFVVRPLRSKSVSGEERLVYSLVGAAYVGGIMRGEMVDELYCEDLMDSTTFYIQ